LFVNIAIHKKIFITKIFPQKPNPEWTKGIVNNILHIIVDLSRVRL